MFEDGNASSLRLLNYPAVAEVATVGEGKSVTRCGVHTDYGGMTLLFQVEIGSTNHRIRKLD